MRTRKGKITLDITKLEKKEQKDLRRLDMLQRQIGMTRNILAMLKKSLVKDENAAEWKPAEIPTPNVAPLEGK